MPDIASVLKSEIARLARKELRAETDQLRKASALYRGEIATLKKRLAILEKQLAGMAKASSKPLPLPAVEKGAHRFSAKGLRTLRQRLELSAADFARLLDVSAQTIYNWETETTRPREQQIAAIAALRGIGKRNAAARLETLPPSEKTEA